MTRFLRLVGLVMIALAAAGMGYSYGSSAPGIRVITSQDGRSLLRIDPASDRQGTTSAQATVFRYDDQSKEYRRITTFALRNPAAPAQALITNNADYIVTFDDWDPQIGRGPNVLVVYRGTGEFLKAWSLEEIITPEELKRLEPPGDIYIGGWPRRWRSETVQVVEHVNGAFVNIPWHPDSKVRVVRQLKLATLALTADFARPVALAK